MDNLHYILSVHVDDFYNTHLINSSKLQSINQVVKVEKEARVEASYENSGILLLYRIRQYTEGYGCCKKKFLNTIT